MADCNEIEKLINTYTIQINTCKKMLDDCKLMDKECLKIKINIYNDVIWDLKRMIGR